MKTFVLIAFMSITILESCYRTSNCRNQFITPAFIGFNLSDLDSIIVRQYKKDANFLQLIDTTLFTFDTTFLKFMSANDTTYVLLNQISGQDKYIFADHDWQIYIPAKHMTISISNITNPQTEDDCFKCSCWNPINSFVQDTQPLLPQIRKIPNLGGFYFYLTYIHN